MRELSSFENPEEPQIPVSVEDVLETDTPFINESADRVLGRAGWLAVRGTAEFLLVVDSLDISDANKARIMGAFSVQVEDWVDFIEEGVEGLGESKDSRGDEHPHQYTLENLVKDVVLAWDDNSIDPNDLLKISDASDDGMVLSFELGSMHGDEIIELVRALKKRARRQALE